MQNTDFNVNERRKSISEIQGIPLFNEKMSFYYDETGNCRKFSLKSDGTVNSVDAINHDFILGGVAFKDDFRQDSIDELYKELHLQASQKELKYKRIHNRSGSFLETLGNHKITLLLDWLLDNPIYIHYSVLNNFYYALVDIVDSLFSTHKDVVASMDKQLKSSLYQFSKEHQDEVLSLLAKYHYPNIQKEESRAFCMEWSDLIQCYNDDSTMEGFYLEMFRQALKYAGNQKELTFLYDNEPEKLIDEYYLLYLERCVLFPDSYHVFDEESVVQSRINEVNLIYNGNLLNNYEFMNSEKSKYLQISDVFVGLLGSLFYYLDNLTKKDVELIFDGKHRTQIKNIDKIGTLINRSNTLSPFFIKNSNDIQLIREREDKISFLSNEQDLQ